MLKDINLEEIKNYNMAIVILRTNNEKPIQVCVNGNFEQVCDDGFNFVIKTNSEFAVFSSEDVQAVHFSRKV